MRWWQPCLVCWQCWRTKCTTSWRAQGKQALLSLLVNGTLDRQRRSRRNREVKQMLCQVDQNSCPPAVILMCITMVTKVILTFLTRTAAIGVIQVSTRCRAPTQNILTPNRPASGWGVSKTMYDYTLSRNLFLIATDCRMLKYGNTHALVWLQSSSSVVLELFLDTGPHFFPTPQPRLLPVWPHPPCSPWWHKIRCHILDVQPYKSSIQYLRALVRCWRLQTIKHQLLYMPSRHFHRHWAALLRKCIVDCFWH